MWVIVAKKGLDKHRDDLISDILDTEKVTEPDLYLKKQSGYSKYTTTTSLSDALIYKQESSCKRFVKKFEHQKNINYVNRYDKFYHIKEYHISYKKVTKVDWYNMCDVELKILEKSYNYQIYKIEQKRKLFGS